MRALLRCLRKSACSSWQTCNSNSWTAVPDLPTTAANVATQQQQMWPQLLQQPLRSMMHLTQQQHSHPWQQQQQQQPQQQQRPFSSWQGMEDVQRHSTTILCIRRGSEVVIIGDGQATQNDFIVKSNVKKVRRIGPAAVGGFAGVAVDGLALLERLENKLEEHPGQLQRAAVELAKMWRQDKLLRELDASLIVADAQTTLWLMGNGDVLEAGADGVIGIGSGADFAESAARALMQLHREKYGDSKVPKVEPSAVTDVDVASAGKGSSFTTSDSSSSSDDKDSSSSGGVSLVYGPDMSLMEVAKAAMKIASDCCVYTNANFSWYHIKPDREIVAGGGAATPAAAAAAAPASASAAASA